MNQGIFKSSCSSSPATLIWQSAQPVASALKSAPNRSLSPLTVTWKWQNPCAAGRCAACGHGILVDGRLQGTGRLYFKPDETKFWVFADSMVGVRARVCAACGFIQMHADTGKLGKLKAGGKK